MSAAVDPLHDLPALLRDAAREAGTLAMRWFRLGERTRARIWTKGKHSAVTEADIETDDYLRRRLGAIEGRFGWLSEETADTTERLSRRQVFVVDPIDGTRAFLDGDPRWCVSIAVVSDGAPIVAVVHAPSLNLTYEATANGPAMSNGAPIKTAAAIPASNARLAGPRFILDSLAAQASIVSVGKIPSLALRLCNVADGSLDAALASKDANDWDIAAADILLEESGARLIDASGERLRYNSRQVRRGALLAASDAAAPRLIKGFRAVISRKAD